MHTTKLAIRMFGRRVLALEADSRHLDELILYLLVQRTAPRLLELYGVGTHTAALLLVAAGDNPQRLNSKVKFAHLCGVAPIPASSGKTKQRYRLNLGGNRQANHALWRIVFTRMSNDERTRKYVERRLAEGRIQTRDHPRLEALHHPASSTPTSSATEQIRSGRAWPTNAPTPPAVLRTNRRPVTPEHVRHRVASSELCTHTSGSSLVCKHRRKNLDNT